MSNGSRSRWRLASLALAAGVILAPGAAPAAEPTRKELEERIRRLERIIEQRGLDKPPPPGAAPTRAEPAAEAEPPVDKSVVEQIVDDKLKKQKVLAGWKDGFFLESPNGDFRLKFRGYVQADGRFFPSESGDTNTDSFYLRRVRPIFEGTVFKYFDFRIMPDFGLGSATIQDAYMDIKYFPLTKLRAGKFKPPVSLERLQSGADLLFIERSIANNLAPNRSVGGMVYGEPLDGLLSYQLGYFNNVVEGGSSDQNVTSSGMIGAGRIWAEPFKTTDANWAKGLGFGIAGVFPGGNDNDESQATLNFRTPGRASFFRYAVSSDVSVLGDGIEWQVVPQAYYYWGPFGFMGEYITSRQDLRRVDDESGSITTGDVTNSGWFVQASYVLTGEDASYKTVVPINPFDPRQGRWGAFEIAARGSRVDVDDAAFTDGFASADNSTTQATQFTVGLNWYFNKNFKFQLNYEHTGFDTDLDFGNGPIDHESAILGQFQISY